MYAEGLLIIAVTFVLLGGGLIIIHGIGLLIKWLYEQKLNGMIGRRVK